MKRSVHGPTVPAVWVKSKRLNLQAPSPGPILYNAGTRCAVTLDLLDLTRDQARAALLAIKDKLARQERPSAEEDLLVAQIEHLLERLVLRDIRQRQARVPGLRQDQGRYLAWWGGELTPGCRDCCLTGAWTQVRSSARCDAACPYCYYARSTRLLLRDHYYLGDDARPLTRRDVELLLDRQGGGLRGVAWLYYEPLLEPHKLPALMRFIHERGLHQWLYTNGLAADPETLALLADAGLEEIRFNLAASGCDQRVLAAMTEARRRFRYVCVESPMYRQFFDTFMARRHAILQTGVDHLHFAELHLKPQTLERFAGEGDLYVLKHGYVSPIASRQLTYDVFDTAVSEGWRGVVLHDCSNEVKFYRGVAAAAHDGHLGRVAYGRETQWLMSTWLAAVERYDLWGAAALAEVT